MKKIILNNLVRLIILVVIFVLYFIYKKRFEGMDDITMPDSSLYYKTRTEILRKAAQSNN